MKILCFGDSNTWGYDPRGYLGGRYDRPWTAILAQEQNYAVINRGENGREIPDNPMDFPGDTDLLIIMLGTNDLLQGASPEEVHDKMEQFLAPMERGKILLIAPPTMKPGTWVMEQRLIENSKALSAYYQSLARRLGVSFADAGKWNIQLAYDGVHLTEKGHRAFAEGLIAYLNKGE